MIEQFLNARFHIDKIEDHYGKERRIAYNKSNSIILLSSDYVKYPTALVYHVMKA